MLFEENWLRQNVGTLHDDMQKAMEAVSDEKLTVSTAEQHFHIPRKPSHDRMKAGTGSGPKTVLSAEEEEALVQYLVNVAFHSPAKW